jgi:hypothetical protein
MPTGTPTINNRHLFHERWFELTGGIFEHVDWSNLFAAGGSVLHCLRVMEEVRWEMILYPESDEEVNINAPEELYNPLSNIEYSNGQYKSTDIDLYIYGLNLEQTRAKVTTITFSCASKFFCQEFNF